MDAINNPRTTAAYALRAATIRVRPDEARIDKLIAEHDPFTTST